MLTPITYDGNKQPSGSNFVWWFSLPTKRKVKSILYIEATWCWNRIFCLLSKKWEIGSHILASCCTRRNCTCCSHCLEILLLSIGNQPGDQVLFQQRLWIRINNQQHQSEPLFRETKNCGAQIPCVIIPGTRYHNSARWMCSHHMCTLHHLHWRTAHQVILHCPFFELPVWCPLFPSCLAFSMSRYANWFYHHTKPDGVFTCNNLLGFYYLIT